MSRHDALSARLRDLAEDLLAEADNRTVQPVSLSDPLDIEHLRTLARERLRRRRNRARYLSTALIGEPGWDILIDMLAHGADMEGLTTTSVCIGSGVPATTALRWIKQLEDLGYIVAMASTHDRRRRLLRLTDKAVQALAGCLLD